MRPSAVFHQIMFAFPTRPTRWRLLREPAAAASHFSHLKAIVSLNADTRKCFSGKGFLIYCDMHDALRPNIHECVGAFSRWNVRRLSACLAGTPAGVAVRHFERSCRRGICFTAVTPTQSPDKKRRLRKASAKTTKPIPRLESVPGSGTPGVTIRFADGGSSKLKKELAPAAIPPPPNSTVPVLAFECEKVDVGP